MAPEIRNTPEMIDAMGGYDSVWYEDYKTKCSRAYNCLRRHANLFMMILSPLYKMRPIISNSGNPFTEDMITEQVMKRFIPNENYQEAKLNFITKIENSHTSSYKSSYYIDYFHKSKDDIYIFEDEIRQYRKNKDKHKKSQSQTKINICISDATSPKLQKSITPKSIHNLNIIHERHELNRELETIDLKTSRTEEDGSPLHFLSVSGLKSSFQNFFLK
jgi:hypothetical protein